MWWSKFKTQYIRLDRGKVYPIIRSYALLTFGLFINALGWTVFLIPAEITSGGMTGVSSLLYYAFDLRVGLTYLVMNAILIVLGIKVLGRSFALKTVSATSS